MLALLIGVVTVILVVIGTLSPVPAAVYYAGGKGLMHSSSTAQAAVDNLAAEIRAHAWENAYASLANKAEFTEPEFVHDRQYAEPAHLRYAGKLGGAAIARVRQRR
jgi:hypothetical protein